MPEKPKFGPFPDYLEEDKIMPLQDWLKAVEHGSFIDYDGFGELATKDQVSNIKISPSDAKIFKFPDWCTHIAWYNK